MNTNTELTLHDVEKLIKETPQQRAATRPLAELTNAELIACLLSSLATKEDGARTLAEAEGSLTNLSRLSIEELMAMPYLQPRSRAVRLAAAFELGRRVEAARPSTKSLADSPYRVAQLLMPQMRGLTHEQVVVLLLNTKNELIAKEVVSQGDISTAISTARVIFAPAIRRGAASVIVAHNHPSGDPTPSREDIKTTEQLVQAGQILGIQLMDHIVVAERGYFSMKEEGII